MTCENASSRGEVASDSPEIAGAFRRSRISYTRDFLMSLAEFDACRQLPSGIDQSILSELHAANSSTAEQKQLIGKEPIFYGGTSGSSSREHAERWDSCKLRPKENNTADFERWRSQRLSQNSGDIENLRSSFQQHNGILGSWSGPKILQDGSEESTSESQGHRPSLLSRCSEPYRPPAFYKATSHSGGQSHISNNETLGSGGDPGNKRAMDEIWRKVSCELAGNEQLKEIKEKHELRPDDQKEDVDPGAYAKLEGCFDPPVTVSNKASVPMYLSGSVEPSSFINEAAEMYPKTGSASHSHLAQVQDMPSKNQTGRNSGRICDAEKLQEQLLDRCHLFAVVDLEESENISPILSEKNNTVVEEDTSKSQSKFLNWFADNEKIAINISPWDNKNGKEAWGEATRLMDKTLHCAQGASISEARKANVAECGSSNSVVQNSYFPAGSSKLQLDKSTRDQNLDSASVVCACVRGGSAPDPIHEFGRDSDSSLEILLHDEDSLIAIDDTYIFQLDEQKPSSNIASKGGRNASSSIGSNKLLESESLHQILSLPDPWSIESQMNAQKLFANPSDSQAYLRASSMFQDPRKIYRKGYDPFAPNLVSHPFRQLLVEPRPYEPLVQQLLSPAMQHLESFSPHIHNTIPPQPVIYQQPHQIPYFQPEPFSLTSHAPHYQRNANPTLDIGRRGMLGDEGSKSAFCHLLQMQMRLAQMNLDAVSSPDERVYGGPMGHWYR